MSAAISGGEPNREPGGDRAASVGEREALWVRLNAATFLTANEKGEAAGYDALQDVEPVADDSVAGEAQVRRSNSQGPVPFAGKYRPDQPRAPRGDPEGGQWVDEGGGGGGQVLCDATPDDFTKPGQRLANAGGGRGSRREVRVTVGDRQYIATPQQGRELVSASSSARAAVERLRRVEPDWAPMPSIRDAARTSEPESAIRYYRNLAQEAQARLTVIDRGYPHGFGSRREFEEFGRFTQTQLQTSGHRYVEVHIRGSALSGYSYTTGKPFDIGRRSDLDLALVNANLFRRASSFGVELRGGRTRTKPLTDAQLRELGLLDVVRTLRNKTKRDVGFVIYQSREALDLRGSSMPMQ